MKSIRPLRMESLHSMSETNQTTNQTSKTPEPLLIQKPNPLTEAQTTLRKKWISALRSGEYTQGKGCLRQAGPTAFCCLGVLSDIVDNTRWKFDEEQGDKYKYGRSSVGMPPQEIADAVGMTDLEINHLASKNDRGVPFSAIADLINQMTPA